MKKQGILNSDISRVLSYLGHTDRIAIGDCGLPIPDETERIDLALAFGIPSFMQTLQIVAQDMKIEKIVAKFNKKYNGLAQAKVEFQEHLKPFEKVDDNRIIEVAQKASKITKVDIDVSSFHAGAETHVYSHEKNSQGKPFKPYLVGVADIYNMHSAEEKVDYDTIIKGYKILKNTFIEFNL